MCKLPVFVTLAKCADVNLEPPLTCVTVFGNYVEDGLAVYERFERDLVTKYFEHHVTDDICEVKSEH